MSELYTVEVTAVGAAAKLSIKTCHPDAPPPSKDATFALMLMFDPVLKARFDKSIEHAKACALARVMTIDHYNDELWLRYNANGFVKKTALAKGTLTIEPTHKAWLEHLRVGMAWSTAAYPSGPGDKTQPRTPAPAPPPGKRDLMAGFEATAPAKKYIAVKKLIAPLHAASKYYADPIFNLQKDVAKAAKDLEGQPVLVELHHTKPIVAANGGFLKKNSTLTLCNINGTERIVTLPTRDVASIGRAYLK